MTEISNTISQNNSHFSNSVNAVNLNVQQNNPINAILPSVQQNTQVVSNQAKLNVPSKPTPAESFYIATNAPEAIVKQPIEPTAQSSTSNIYDQLQKKAESAEITALRGTPYERFYFKNTGLVSDSILGNYIIGSITALAIISMILPLLALGEFVKYIYLPSLLLMSICLMLQVALKIRQWINSLFIATFAIQLFIALFVLIRFVGMLNLELPIINWYISKFYL